MQLQNLYLTTNNLSSTIPGALGNCESLEDIELDQNSFVGSIPASLGNICNLKVLNMSRNQLSGSIPKSFGDLPFVEQLDLSFNHLEGEVPENGIFRNATAIHIDGNKWFCGGPELLHLPACSITHTSAATKKKRIDSAKSSDPTSQHGVTCCGHSSSLAIVQEKTKEKIYDHPFW